MTARKRKGIFVSKDYVKPEGFDIFLPKGSLALKRAELLRKRELSLAKKRVESRKRQLSDTEKELIRLLDGKEVEVKGQYKMDRFIFRSNGRTLTILYRSNPNAEPKPVKDLSLLTRAIKNASQALQL